MSRAKKHLSVIILAFFFCLLAAGASRAAPSQVVDEVQIVTGTVGSEIHIFFHSRFQYVTHAPPGKSDYLRIQLQPIGAAGVFPEDVAVAEDATWKPTPGFPLLAVRYEGGFTTTSGPSLELRFDRPLAYAVTGASDLRSIIIALPGVTAGAAVTQPPTSPEPSSAPALPFVKEAPQALKVIEPVQRKRRVNAAPIEMVADAQFVIPQEARLLSPERLAAMREEAKQAMTAEDYRRAIQLYSRMLQHPDPELHKEVLEFLGLARERNGQLAHAKSLYEEYLARFPKDEGAARVQQRLAGLLTARAQPKAELRKARKVVDDKEWETDIFGSISQFYEYDESSTEGERSENLNSFASDAHLSTRWRSKDYDFRATFAGSNENDFTDRGDDEARLSALFIDAFYRPKDIYLRLGRQTENSGGILGRFDGALASYGITPTIKINGVFGYPVESTRVTEIDTRRHFYGFSFDFGTYADRWDFSTYFINQEVDSITDRQAVGGEVRYFDPRRTFFGMVDYDIFYDELNLLLALGTLTVRDDTVFRLGYDYRRSPLLTTNNALQGQGVESISDLLFPNSEDDVQQLARDRTAEQTSLNLGVNRPLSQKWQIDGAVTRAEISDTAASGGVEATPGSEDFYYDVQLIGSGLLKEGDVSIISARYSDTDMSNTIMLSADIRYPLTKNLRLNPRLRWDYQERDDRINPDGSTRPGTGSTRERWLPMVRLDYRVHRNFLIEFGAGAEFETQKSDDGTETETDGYFVTLGYRILF